MIKFLHREMDKLSRILTVILCCTPVFTGWAGPVATTAGSNLTAYNPSTAYNNQWATMTNGRYDGDTTAKVDFGNCNAVVLRCAQPKCSGGGCTDASVAGAIVSGCVKSNDKCKQYGDDLIAYMTAQLVANSNAKIQEQQVALEQAKIQAEAQAAAAAAANSQNEQMMSQMQNQMYQMQQQMAQQQEESNRQLQEALAQQAAQSAAALESMKTAATDAAQQTESGITSYQQEAIERGISTDVLERQKITGQIMTEIENADLELKKVKVAMQNSFDYAKCDARGNNCSAPKRIKKWRELATGFLDPYDETIDKIYDALITAQTVGVDLNQIYAMLSNACNSWSEYLCPGMGDNYYIQYGYFNGEEYKSDAPRVCHKNTNTDGNNDDKNDDKIDANKWKNCRPCTWVRNVTNEDDIYQGYVNIENKAKDNQTVVACASSALDGNKLFSRHNKKKKGDGVVEIDTLDKWLHQVEPNNATGAACTNDTKQGLCYCGVDYQNNKVRLEQAASKKSVSGIDDDPGLCVKTIGKTDKNSADDKDDCTYINPIFGICDTHPYNASKTVADWNNLEGAKLTEAQEQMNEIIGLKITVISQQMYKQYEYLRATLQRLKIQLEKSVLTANLEAAGAKSEDGSSSSGLLGGGRDSDKTIHLAGANNCSNFMDFDSAYNCLQNNVTVIKNNVSSNAKKACLQLQSTVADAKSILTKDNFDVDKDNNNNCKKYWDNKTSNSCASQKKEDIINCANDINMGVMKEKRDQAQKSKTKI